MRARYVAIICVAALALAGLSASAATAASHQGTSGGTVLIGVPANETRPSVPGKAVQARQTVTAWAKATNAAGGINGHKIKVVAMDDGYDPAKASANVKDMIDQGVVAFVGNDATGTTSSWAPVADKAGVPIIGGGCYDITLNADQNFFCVTTTAITDGLRAQTRWAADRGAKVFGITYDSTVPQAAAAAPLFKALAIADGMKFSEAIGTSLTQPDYTAECITFKQSGTTDVGLEAAPLIQNIARDCARQDYYPQWTSGGAAIGQDSWQKDPNVKKAISAIYSFPYFLTKGDTPEQTKSLQTFQKTMKKYAPGVLKSDNKGFSTTYYTGALAFGEALSRVPSGTAVTPQAITDAMNSFKDETLGGLAPNPLTFVAGQEHPHNSCWWGLVLKNHKLKAPKGMKTLCTPEK